jgi:hypothetical protein
MTGTRRRARMAVPQVHPHLHVLDLLWLERIEVGVIYPD